MAVDQGIISWQDGQRFIREWSVTATGETKERLELAAEELAKHILGPEPEDDFSQPKVAMGAQQQKGYSTD